MFNSAINGGFKTFRPSRPSQSPDQNVPGQGQPQIKPFVNPDVFRPSQPLSPDGLPGFPSQPLSPDGLPGFPSQPLQLPPFTGDPSVEVPLKFPIELPTLPSPIEWTKFPGPSELPDWSKRPNELPGPTAPEIQTPKQFPAKTYPDGVWFLS